MTDLDKVFLTKSDQINADDLIAGPRVVTIISLRIVEGAEQPVHIRVEEFPDRLWKPCKTVFSVLKAIWGNKARDWTGRKALIYNDTKVKWGGVEVGGVRVAAMSHLEGSRTVVLNVSKTKKAPITVRSLTEDDIKKYGASGETGRSTEESKISPKPEPAPEHPTPDFMSEWEGAVNLVLMSDDPEQIRSFWQENVDSRKLAAKTNRERATAIRERVEKYL